MTYSEIIAELPKQAVTEINDLPFPRIASGKVREIFDLGDALLIVATDRISAFDVILPDGVPGKGIILQQLSNYWFAQTGHIIRNHMLPNQHELLADKYKLPRDLELRSMVVKKLQPLPIECVVRGYLAGSGWSSYVKRGDVCGIRLPPGLRQADRLPTPLFTPTTKAPKGLHDEPISDWEGEAAIGITPYRIVKEASLELYQFGHERAARCGIILADTKFEFGRDENRDLVLIDEILTPDSSRYWPQDQYAPNQSPPSFDKQFVRDYLLSVKWDQKSPAPKLPPEVIRGTQEKYLTALKSLVG